MSSTWADFLSFKLLPRSAVNSWWKLKVISNWNDSDLTRFAASSLWLELFNWLLVARLLRSWRVVASLFICTVSSENKDEDEEEDDDEEGDSRSFSFLTRMSSVAFVKSILTLFIFTFSSNSFFTFRSFSLKHCCRKSPSRLCMLNLFAFMSSIWSCSCGILSGTTAIKLNRISWFCCLNCRMLEELIMLIGWTKLKTYPLLKFVNRWRMMCLNLFVQLLLVFAAKSVSVVVSGPWSMGNGFRPSSSYNRPLIGTKQMKWNISWFEAAALLDADALEKPASEFDEADKYVDEDAVEDDVACWDESLVWPRLVLALNDWFCRFFSGLYLPNINQIVFVNII